jgi:hypothetical protein
MTSGCPWPKATVKSLVGACNLRPLFLIFSYFLLFIFYCPGRPAQPRPYPALSLPCPCPALPCFEFSFCCQGQEEEVTQGTGSVFFSFCCQGQEEEVTQGTGSVLFSFCCQGQEEEVTPCPARQTYRQTDRQTCSFHI